MSNVTFGIRLLPLPRAQCSAARLFIQEVALQLRVAANEGAPARLAINVSLLSTRNAVPYESARRRTNAILLRSALRMPPASFALSNSDRAPADSCVIATLISAGFERWLT